MGDQIFQKGIIKVFLLTMEEANLMLRNEELQLIMKAMISDILTCLSSIAGSGINIIIRDLISLCISNNHLKFCFWKAHNSNIALISFKDKQ